MGKGTITYEDTDDGTIKVSIEFDPPVSDNDATPAQATMFAHWAKLQGISDDEE